MKPKILNGDILKQPVEVIVNPWNRNIIPWWLLLPQGVSGAIKKKAGLEPFKELATFGPIELGGARVTSPGNLPFKKIIHVAGINMFWLATKYSIEQSVMNAMGIVNSHHFKSVAFPLIGAGSGNRSHRFSLDTMLSAFDSIETGAEVIITLYSKG